MAAIKEAVKAAAKLDVAQGVAPSGQGPHEPSGAHVALAPAQEGQGLQQASQAFRPHGALQVQECAGPVDGVPPARKAGPQSKARRASLSVAAAKSKKKNKP